MTDTSEVDLGLCLLNNEDSAEFGIEMNYKAGLYYFFHSQNFNYWIDLKDTQIVNGKCLFRYKVYYNPKAQLGLHSDSVFFNFYIKKKLFKHLIVFKSNVVEVKQSSLKEMKILGNYIPSVIFDSISVQLDTLIEGQTMLVKLRLRNVDTLPIVLHVDRICSCEAPSWTYEPILPGKYGQVELMKNTDGKVGQNNRVLTIKANGVAFDINVSYYVKPKS